MSEILDKPKYVLSLCEHPEMGYEFVRVYSLNESPELGYE